MFNSIVGRLTDKGPTSVFIFTGGIEWIIHTTTSSISDLPEIGQDVKVYLYLHHREDSMQLYGFSTEVERTIFLDLITISGIGPKQALKILSGSNVEEFAQTIERGDVDRLSTLPGLGKKTAQKIVLALSGKLQLPGESEEIQFREIVEGLIDMGFDKKRAVTAVNEAAQGLSSTNSAPDSFENELFKQAIIILSS
jgi:holliday junction DNA helicase RuvA